MKANVTYKTIWILRFLVSLQIFQKGKTNKRHALVLIKRTFLAILNCLFVWLWIFCTDKISEKKKANIYRNDSREIKVFYIFNLNSRELLLIALFPACTAPCKIAVILSGSRAPLRLEMLSVLWNMQHRGPTCVSL